MKAQKIRELTYIEVERLGPRCLVPGYTTRNRRIVEAPNGVEPLVNITVLKTCALPVGYGASAHSGPKGN